MKIVIYKEVKERDFIYTTVMAECLSLKEAEEFVLSYCGDKSNNIKDIFSWKFVEFYGFKSKRNCFSRVQFDGEKLNYTLHKEKS